MMRLFSICLVIILTNSCKINREHDTNDDILLIEKAFNQLQYASAVKKFDYISKEKIFPRSTDKTGKLRLVDKKDWTSGFFPGVLWLMYDLTKENNWKGKAIEYTQVLESEKFNASNHDIGFKMMSSFGLGYKITNNKNYREILIRSAKTLVTRFNENVGSIRSWDHNKDKWEFPVIIDNLMNLELLFWAWKETGDSVFYNIAVKHAKTTKKNHFRNDFSTYHVVGYNSDSGKVVSKNTYQGYADESCWARGQAWALYGYTMIYRETQNPEFLKQAENIANYIINIASLPKDYIPLWDFSLLDIEKEPRDTSAAAIIASALFELSTFTEYNKTIYLQVANRIMESLSSNQYFNTLGENNGFLLKHATGHKPMNSEIDVPLIYADYYYLEALSRKIKIKNN
ncbi:glycoside hydrolase family 88 protein [Flavivirga jejuensis]|uniref:Glycoside hydrolase family 88 protein n=1 Tax=Flavivirga jejuensis TaxID=870487 RepID=A0ABT8WM96_9FLAO|nr:glycoside hydrolase family 88 protein [Flavivirga jejuensis]MDO5974281.1 glycoside hydrolase family 88 protein [Flavivirga jejuensis]